MYIYLRKLFKKNELHEKKFVDCERVGNFNIVCDAMGLLIPITLQITVFCSNN